jgi:hypothetical protein
MAKVETFSAGCPACQEATESAIPAQPCPIPRPAPIPDLAPRPPPWTAVETPDGWRVNDAPGFAVAYVYREDRARGASDLGMSRDEAWRIAIGIARLPELVGWER